MEKGILEPIEVSENALIVLRNRYLRKDDRGEVVETPEELFWRVARAIAGVEKSYGATEEEVEALSHRFYTMMSSFQFLPNSPTLMNAGTPIGQLSACFVLPVEDSIEGIFEAVKNAAKVHQTGGGTGFSFSRLRPKGDLVKTTGGVASGPVSFMKVFNGATEAIKQGGRRRGANMGILRVDHPDILEFITCKDDVREITNFNISVAVTDAFMEAVEEDEEYNLINPRTGQATGRLRAREVFEKLCYQAWKNGEPGVIFIDKMNEATPVHHPEFQIEATNPCGEQPLLPYEVCNLGSIHVAKFYRGTPWYLEKKRPARWKEVRNRFDWNEYGKIVRLCTHFLDNVIDANLYPIPEIERMAKNTRKIGLGIMGFADLLYLMGIPYSSEDALQACEELMKVLYEQAREESRSLAEQKGSFPWIEYSIFKGTPMRNACVNTIAPTGTISMIADASSGIEPHFSIVWMKQVMEGTKLYYSNPYFLEASRELGFHSEALFQKISEAPSIKGFKEIPDYIRAIFETTFDIPMEQHIRIQAAAQKYVDASVSKTINLPNSATVEDIGKAYHLAYRLHCKGVTVYRDGSRPQQVLNVGTKETEYEGTRKVLKPRPRPQITSGKTIKMDTELGHLYITINEDEKGIFEVFANIGKSGSALASLTEAVGRLISLAFRSGIRPDDVIEQLKGIRSILSRRQEDGTITHSIPDAIAKAIEKYLGLNGDSNALLFQLEEPELKSSNRTGETKRKRAEPDLCPDCGGILVMSEGCAKCYSCGYSNCG